jgi:hypothetical protein
MAPRCNIRRAGSQTEADKKGAYANTTYPINHNERQIS